MLAPTLDAVSAFIDANSNVDTMLTRKMGAGTQAAVAHTHDKTPAP